MRGVIVCALAALLAVTAVGELMFEDFDAYALGPVTDNAGWSAGGGGTVTGQVSDVDALSGNHALLLPWQSSDTVKATAVCTNFHHAAASDVHPVVHASAWIFRENKNQAVVLTLSNGASGALTVSQDPADATLLFNGVDTDVPIVTNAWVSLHIFYDTAGNKAALDYNGQRVAEWAAFGGSPIDAFTAFGAERAGGAGTEGVVLFDDMCFETFDPDIVAWWRFEEGVEGHVHDHLGTYPPTDTSGYLGAWHPGCSDPLYDGAVDVHNRWARRNPQCAIVRNRIDTGSMDAWTAEAIVRSEEPDVHAVILELGHEEGFGVNTNSWISLEWYYGHIQLRLREEGRTTTGSAYISNAGSMPEDGRWHHVALVVTGGVATTYVDYVPLSTNTLPGEADGPYRFNTNSVCRLGVAFNNANAARQYDSFDDVRFSRRALFSDAFMQPGRPIILNGGVDSGPTAWAGDVRTIPGMRYHPETKPDLGLPGWAPFPSTSATEHMTRFAVPLPADSNLFVRIVRE
jgi:hypothetical protein